MVSAEVWEAVSSFNNRTSIGRVVVNPPAKRGEVAARPTSEVWHFCRCGKAFSNPENYELHLKTHSNGIITLQLSLPSTPVKKIRDVSTSPKAVKTEKAVSSTGFKEKITKKTVTTTIKPQVPSPKQIVEVRSAPKGIKSIKGIKLYGRGDPTIRSMPSPPTLQPTNTNVYECKQCGKFFIAAPHLRAHIRIKHTPLIENFESSIRVKITKSSLLNSAPGGQQLGENLTSWFCKRCKVDLKTRGAFLDHEKITHGGEGQHCCPFCPKKTIVFSVLRRHMKIYHKLAKPTTNIRTRSLVQDDVPNITGDSEILHDSNLVPVTEPVNNELLNNFTSTRSGSHRKLPLTENKKNKDNLPKCEICNKVYYSMKLLLTHKLQKHTASNGKLNSTTDDSKKTPEKKSDVASETPASVETMFKNSSENKFDNGYEDVSKIRASTRTRSKVRDEKEKASSTTVSMEVTTQDMEVPVNSESHNNDVKELAVTCDVCGLSCDTRRGLIYHKREAHPIENKLKCRVCGKQCTSGNRLATHMITVHRSSSKYKKLLVSKLPNKLVEVKNSGNPKNGEYYSLKNKKISGSPIKLNILKNKANDEVSTASSGSFDCSLCEKKFSHSFSLSQHLKNHTSAFPCDICGTGFTVRSNLELHNKKAHVPGGKYVCQICPCVYENHKGLASHVAHRHKKILKTNVKARIREDNNEKISKHHSEADATKNETRYDLLKRALAGSPQKLSVVASSNSPNKAYNLINCDICGCQIVKDLMSAHIEEAHPASGVFRCLQCVCVFESFKGLSTHKRTHHFYSSSSTKSRTLRKTGTALSSSNGANQFIKKSEVEAVTKLEETLSSCNLCGLSIPSGDAAMQKHLQISHVTNSPFKCKLCSCSFRDRHSLVVHMTNVVHPGSNHLAESPLIKQHSVGVVQVVPKFSPIRPLPQKINNETLEDVEDDVPKIIMCFSQNPEYLEKCSPTKNDQVLQPKDNPTSRTGSLLQLIESKAMIIQSDKDVQEVQVTRNISLINKVATTEDGKREVGTRGNRKTALIKKSLFPPPPMELTKLATEFQLPSDLTVPSGQGFFSKEHQRKQKLNPFIAKPYTSLNNGTQKVSGSDYSTDNITLATILGTAPEIIGEEPSKNIENSTIHQNYISSSATITPLSLSSVGDDVEELTRTRNKTKLATCAVCRKSFFNQQKYMKHMKTHEKEKEISKSGGKCGYCGQNFQEYAALWAHLKECRGNKSVINPNTAVVANQ